MFLQFYMISEDKAFCENLYLLYQVHNGKIYQYKLYKRMVWTAIEVLISS